MIAQRKASPALREGAIDLPPPPDGAGAWAFVRSGGGEALLCAFNFSDQAGSFAPPRPPKGRRMTVGAVETEGNVLRLAPYSGVIIEI